MDNDTNTLKKQKTIADQDSIIETNDETIKNQKNDIANLTDQKKTLISDTQTLVANLKKGYATEKENLGTVIADLEFQKGILVIDIKNLNSQKDSWLLVINSLSDKYATIGKNLTDLEDQQAQKLKKIALTNNDLILLNHQKIDKQAEFNAIQIQINDVQTAKIQAQKELGDIILKQSDAQKNLDVMVQKGAFWVDKEDYLNSQEKYIALYYQKIGREYQPFQPNTP